MIPTLIIDGSLAIAWCFGDQADPLVARVQDRMVDESALVPSHWPLEVAQALATAEMLQLISPADAAQFLQLLLLLNIQVDDQTAARAFDHVLPLSRRCGLSSYHAAYLELAVRRQLPLATIDPQLRQAAISFGLPEACP